MQSLNGVYVLLILIGILDFSFGQDYNLTCSGTQYLTAESGVFGCYPTYTAYLNCTWIITPPPGFTSIIVQFRNFTTERSYGIYLICFLTKDIISLYDADYISSTSLIYQLSGNISSSERYGSSQANALTATFITDSGIQFSGISFYFFSIKGVVAIYNASYTYAPCQYFLTTLNSDFSVSPNQTNVRSPRAR